MNNHELDFEKAEKYLETTLSYWENEKQDLEHLDDYEGDISEYLSAIENEIFWGEILKANLETAKNNEPGKAVADLELDSYVDVYLRKKDYSKHGRSISGP